MLKGIDPLLGPDLLGILRSMGHGDEIVVADANFPAASTVANQRLVRADGSSAPRMVEAIVSVLPLGRFRSCSRIPHGRGRQPDEIPQDHAAHFEQALKKAGYGGPIEADRTQRLLRPREDGFCRRRDRRDAALRQPDPEEGRDPPRTSLMRIDAHQHFWRIERGDYGWLTAADHPKIARDFLPADLEPLLKAANIDKTMLVQAAPTEAETLFLLELADASPFIAGVVGWVDFDAADAASRIARLSARPTLLGLRPMIQDMADDEWMLRSELARPFEAMQRADLCFDALVKPRHLPALDRISRSLSRPRRRHRPWRQARHCTGRHRPVGHLYAPHREELGRVLQARRAWRPKPAPNWSAAALKPYVDILLASFGPSRVMWGSDWPVLNEAGDYASWLAVAEELTQHLPREDRDAIFGGAAAEFYRLN